MPIIMQGSATGVGAEVEAATRALRITPRAIDYGSNGSYQVTSKSGTMAAGLSANSPIYAFRNAHASLLVSLRRVRLSAWSLATGFAVGIGTFDLFRASAWSAADTGGVTDTLTTINGKLRSTMATIQAIAEIRHASTTLLTAGTRVLDAQAVDSVSATVTATAQTVFVTPGTKLFEKTAFENQFILAPNEGVVVLATVPATGTWGWAITTEWDELAAYQP
jgi:hypothetical protein